MQLLRDAIDSLVHAETIPSASVSVWVEGAEVFSHAQGAARLMPYQQATEATPYDLASVTKPFAGGAVAAALVRDGRLDLDAEVRRVLDDVPAGVTARRLLQHAAGYAAWSALYERVPRDLWGTPEARASILRAARTSPLVYTPGAGHTYSDLGFLTLLSLLEHVGEAPIDELVRAHLTDPAGVALRWGWAGAAATEDCPVRGEVVQGVVHDLNCFAMGGRSTHAGLFGTAAAVGRLTSALLDQTIGLDRGLPDLTDFWRAEGPGSHRLGWDGVTLGAYTSTGRCWPADGVGHLGYTGTSVWVAPRQRVVAVLLTNRVHPRDDKQPIREARPRFHDALAACLGWPSRG